jgi:hypothetical protein
MKSVSRRTVAILRAAGINAKALSLSDLERGALWAGPPRKQKRRSA